MEHSHDGAEPSPRTIDYGRHTLHHPWPADCHVQGSSSGLVFTSGGSYRTAFVEASPTEPRTFIRGEGATIAEAEDAAWAKYERVSAGDHEHEFEPRGYRNGAGVCKHCGLFVSKVFTPEQVGVACSVCGTPTFHQVVAGTAFCADHAVDFDTREQIRADARAEGKPISQLEAVFDRLAHDQEEEDR